MSSNKKFNFVFIMKRRFLTILLYFVLLTHFPAVINGQNVKTLPTDPRIKKGTIANGFTYYLVDNEVRKGYADFYLVRRVGSIYEDSLQVGFNSIIGDMGVEGTRNFPNNTILTYFDELGLNQDVDFESKNGLENSFYRVGNIPIKKGDSVIDSTLLILYNWAVNINLDEEDVEKGKLLYQNSLAKSNGGDFFANSEHMSEVIEVGDMTYEGLNSCLPDASQYKSKDLRSFYYKWFSPDRMAIIVVGDIDVNTMETKIKSLFQAMPRFLEKEEDRCLKIKNYDSVLVSVVEYEGIASSKMTISFTTNTLPKELNSSAVPFVNEYMCTMMKEIVMKRLMFLSNTSSVAFYPKSVNYGEFFDSSMKEALQIEILVPSTDAVEALSEVLKMLYTIKRQGFSHNEFERAKNQYLKNLKYQYDWRIFTPNAIYAQRSLNNYIYNHSLASIEMKKEYMDIISNQIGVNQLNMFVSSFLRGGDNCVITYTIPKGCSNGTDYLKERFKRETYKIINRDFNNSYTDTPFKDFILKKDESTGSIISKYPEMISGAKVWNLSNGATVVYKKSHSEPNKFSFEAISKGGLTLLPASSHARSFINEISSFSPVGEYSAQQYALYLRDMNLEIQRSIDFNTCSLKGCGYASDIESFLSLVYGYFLPSKGDKVLFEKYKKIKREELYSLRMNPERIFTDSLSKHIYYDSRYITTQNCEDLDLIDYDSVISFINKRFSNAANYYFIIVGDIDESLLEGLVAKYIATLPGSPSDKENWQNVPIYLKKYNQDRVLSIDVSYPKNLYNLTLTSQMSYNLKEVVEVSIASEIIKKRVSRKMKDRGYPVEIETKWVMHPEEFITFAINSATYNYSDTFLEELNNVLNDLNQNGPTTVEISNAKKVLIETQSIRESESNDFWREILVNRFIYGKDFYSRYAEFIKGTTDKQVKDVLNHILTESYKSSLILKSNN